MPAPTEKAAHWVQLEGWALAQSPGQGVVQDEDKTTFYVNVDAAGVAQRGDCVGFLVEVAGYVWFLEMTLEQASQMVQGWMPGPSA